MSDITVSHISLSLTADFTDQRIYGHALLQVKGTTPNTLVLNTRKLKINSVCASDENGSELDKLKYELGEHDETFGAELKVDVVKGLKWVKVDYSTACGDECSALQWLPKEQTKDGKHPFMFSQCQAIHARSLLPCIDSPGEKFTYDAQLTVPSPLTALMSAVSTSNSTKLNTTGHNTFTFEQKIPIPSYLVAVACGFLDSREIGPRSKVYAEPSMVQSCAKEFEDTENFLKIAEELLTPYEWGRYDLLVLPPSFPYGGMENPCLTFVTPTLLAGDKSLVGVVAHEIAHSWMGNLVTNSSWDYFWMNEGFTVFCERKIMAKALGSETAGFHLKGILGYKALQNTVDSFGKQHPFTCLNIDHSGIDPDDAFSRVPYEKGFNFLFYLQELCGGAKVFEPFLKVYVNKFRLSVVTPAAFRELFEAYMKEQHVPKETLDKIDWEAWLHTPGMPLSTPNFDYSLYTRSEEVGKGWVESGTMVSIDGWTTDQKVLALVTAQNLVKSGKAVDCNKLDTQYNFSKEGNKEVLFAWLMLCIFANYKPAKNDIVAFVTSLGRMKFVRPVYQELFKGDDEFKKLAVSTFKQHKTSYHSICQKMVAKDLRL